MNLDPVSQLVGVVATTLSVSSVAMRCDRRLRVIAGIGQAVWSHHFWLLGAPTTSATCALACSRQLSSLFTHRWSQAHQTGIALGYYAAFTLAMVLTWQGWTSLLPWSCAMIANHAYSSMSGLAMRKALRGCDMIAIVNVVLVGSIGGLVTCVAAIALNSLTIAKLEGRATDRLIASGS